MGFQWKLSISLGWDYIQPLEGEVSLLSIRGGPKQLLDWLETQLGLVPQKIPQSIRISQYANLLDRFGANTSYSHSFAVDRWATATELLNRRDELRMAGWKGEDVKGLPSIVQDLANVEKEMAAVLPGLPERLERIARTLEQGQPLPLHEIVLFERSEQWPPLWRPILTKLSAVSAVPVVPLAAPGSTLIELQKQILSGEKGQIKFDSSFRWLQCVNRLEACQVGVQLLASDPSRLSSTSVMCKDEMTAFLLDGCIAQAGLPTLGARLNDPYLPILQVLPLALRLLWEPVDPAILLDFLCLPISPIPRKAAGRLAEALVEQPGYRSDAWQKAAASLTEQAKDPEGNLRNKLNLWFEIQRYAINQPLPAAAVAAVCSRVAQWAAGYAAVIDDEAISSNLMEAASQASMVSELACSAGGLISEPQLGRILDAAMDKPNGFRAHSAVAGGPRLITSLSELHSPCDRLIWVGLGSADPMSSHWTSLEAAQMRACGLEVDDSHIQTSAVRDAERRGLAQIRSCLFAISIPFEKELRLHPVWLQIQNALGDKQPALPLTRAFAKKSLKDFSPWSPIVSAHTIVPVPDALEEWDVERGLIATPQRSSATELADRLGCPVKWMFEHAAHLYSSPIARLPKDATLLGNFGHSILAAVFGSGGDLPSTEEAIAQVERLFDESLPRNAAPLAQPWAIVQKTRLREELKNSTRVLVEALRSAGFRIISMEKQIVAELDGRPCIAYIDCLTENQSGAELVIDFKFYGEKKYRSLLSDGRAVQLATYAAMRAAEKNNTKMPFVAYLILSSGILLIPQVDAPPGLQRVQHLKDAPPIRVVWQRFITALRGSEAWLHGDKPVPSRPHQSPESWPEGADMVLDGPNSKGEMPGFSEQTVCKYCNYGVLCGARRLF